MVRTALRRALAAVLVIMAAFGLEAQNNAASPRLYVFDGGVLASETARYRLTDADVEEVELSVASYLIVHPRGVLLWDAGAVADHERSGPVGFEQRLTRPETYSALKNARMTVLTEAEHDVFGDGTVVIRPARGHTEGHSVLYLKLAKTGGVVLSGDLYHYPAERTLKRLPTFEVSEAGTQAARDELEQFLLRTNAALWIQHDLVAHRKLKKSPESYD